jgi:transposase
VFNSRSGLFLKFLLPYFPDRNPIERWWFVLKNAIRREISAQEIVGKAAEKILKQASEPI